MTDQESIPKKPRYSFKSPTRGGARKGSGRKKGTPNKITGEQLLADFRKVSGGQTLSQFIVKKMMELHNDQDNKNLIQLLSIYSKYMITSVEQIDITTKGDKLNLNLIINSKEAPGWNDD